MLLEILEGLESDSRNWRAFIDQVKRLNAFDSHAFPISLAPRAVEKMVLHTDTPDVLGDVCWIVNLESHESGMYVIHRGEFLLLMFIIFGPVVSRDLIITNYYIHAQHHTI